jgi:hypothetical protein
MRVHRYGYAQTIVWHKYKNWQIELYSTYKDFIICRNFDNILDVIVKHIVPQKGGKIDSSIRPLSMMKVSSNDDLIVYSKRGLAIMKLDDIIEKKHTSVKARVYSVRKDFEVPDGYSPIDIGDLINVTDHIIAIGVNCWKPSRHPNHNTIAYVVFINTETGCIWKTEHLEHTSIVRMEMQENKTVLAICDNECSWEEDFKDNSTVFHKIPTIYAVDYATGAITGKLAQSVEPTQ